MTPITQAGGDTRSTATADLPFDAALAAGAEPGEHVAQTIDPTGEGARTIVLTIDPDAPGATRGQDPSILDGGLDTHWVVPDRRTGRFARADVAPRPVAEPGPRRAAEPGPRRAAEPGGRRAAEPAPYRTGRAPSRVEDVPPAAAPRRRTARRPEPFVKPSRAAEAAREQDAARARGGSAGEPRDRADRGRGDRDPRPAPRTGRPAEDEPRRVEPRRPRRSADAVADRGFVWHEPPSAATTAIEREVVLVREPAPATAEIPLHDVAPPLDPASVAVEPRSRRGREARSASQGPIARRASGPAGGASARRTVQIGGTSTAAGVPRLVELQRRRPVRGPMERLSERPDRIAMWAFLLGLFLILVAAASGNAATL